MRPLFAALLSLCLAAPALAVTPEEEVQHYVDILKGEASRHKSAIEELQWKGISDTRVYDLIEQRLNAEADAGRGSREDKDRVAWYIRGLGFSGQQKYAATISRFGGDRVFRRHAENALEDLPLYAKWNKLISDRGSWDPKLGDDANRVMNMLRANDLLLNRLGAKSVYYRHPNDAALLDVLAERTRAAYKSVSGGREEIDSVAWMVKALGNSGSPKYLAVVEEVRDQAPDARLRKQAAGALRRASR